MQKIIDTHHHFWKLNNSINYPWLQGYIDTNFFLGDYKKIRKDFLPKDLFCQVPLGYKLIATVHCEAECQRNQSYDEAKWIAALTITNPVVAKAQMVWIDLLSDELESQIQNFKMIKNVKGVRFKPRTANDCRYYNELPISGSLKDKQFINALKILESYDLIWDLRVPAWHLFDAARLINNFTHLKVVINHTGLPWDRTKQGINRWKEGLAEIAQYPYSWLKLSELGSPNLKYDHSKNTNLIKQAIQIFGGYKCMYASNTPVSSVQVSYGNWLKMLESAIADVAPELRQEILWKNAAQCYGLSIETNE